MISVSIAENARVRIFSEHIHERLSVEVCNVNLGGPRAVRIKNVITFVQLSAI